MYRPDLPAARSVRHILSLVAIVLAAAAAACTGSHEVVANWRMVDRTMDQLTDAPPGADHRGADGAVDNYDNAQGTLIRGVNGNISTKFPADGRYEVVLDACGSHGATRFSWRVDRAAPVETSECATTVRLPEGPHSAHLEAFDEHGHERSAELSLLVRDLIVVGLGDSFSAGSGDSRGGLVSLDYDNIPCTRSGRSGQARAALELERRDPKTSVTFIHLACGGARAGEGFLSAHNGQPPQILELSEILPPGKPVDFVSFTIGGNDIRFSEIVAQLIAETDAPLSLLEGEVLHDRTQRKLFELRDTMARVAACFGEGFEGRPCQVVGPTGRPDDLTPVFLDPIPVVTRERIVQVTYPDLTTRFMRDAAGNVVPGPDGKPKLETCPSGAVEEPGDLLDGLLDGRINGRPQGTTRAPFLSQSEWAWGDAALLRPTDPAPADSTPAEYSYEPEDGRPGVPLLLMNTLNSLVMESHERFGWTTSQRWWTDSRGHGYCSPESDNWFLRAIFHPNDAGYVGKAAGLVAEAERLGVVPSAH
jgi:hypothetical protein